MPNLTIALNGNIKAGARMKKIVSGIDDFRPMWKGIKKDFVSFEKLLFSTQGARGKHGRWKALSPAYRKRKPPGLGILVLGGNLRDSLTVGNADTISELSSPHFMKLGTKAKTAAWHQNGTSKMPKRRPIDIDDSLTDKWFKRIQVWGSKILSRR